MMSRACASRRSRKRGQRLEGHAETVFARELGKLRKDLAHFNRIRIAHIDCGCSLCAQLRTQLQCRAIRLDGISRAQVEHFQRANTHPRFRQRSRKCFRFGRRDERRRKIGGGWTQRLTRSKPALFALRISSVGSVSESVKESKQSFIYLDPIPLCSAARSTNDARILNVWRHLEHVAVGSRLFTSFILDAVFERHFRADHRLAAHLHELRIVIQRPDDVAGEFRRLSVR